MADLSKINTHGYYGGIFWRQHHFAKAGDYHEGHKHHIDHATVIVKGGVHVKIEDVEFDAYAPAVLEIDKDKFHQFTALEDGTAYLCVFATHDIDKTIQKPLDKAEKLDFLKGLLCSDCSGCPSK